MGARIKVYDPVAQERYRQNYAEQNITYCESADETARESDALVLLTAWDEFLHLSWLEIGKNMKSRIIIDGRNMLNSEELERIGFKYSGIGR